MNKTKIIACDNCPLWNDDRMYCQHPKRNEDDQNWKDAEWSDNNEPFATCPIKKEPIYFEFEENTFNRVIDVFIAKKYTVIADTNNNEVRLYNVDNDDKLICEIKEILSKTTDNCKINAIVLDNSKLLIVISEIS